jgi:hypothetical protein
MFMVIDRMHEDFFSILLPPQYVVKGLISGQDCDLDCFTFVCTCVCHSRIGLSGIKFPVIEIPGDYMLDFFGSRP